jgi:hypothetical protein
MAKQTVAAQATAALATEAAPATLPAVKDVAHKMDAQAIAATRKALGNAAAKRGEWGGKAIDALSATARHVAALPTDQRIPALADLLGTLPDSDDATDMLRWITGYALTAGCVRIGRDDAGRVTVSKPKRGGDVTLSETFRKDWFAGSVKGLRESRRANPAERQTEIVNTFGELSRFVARFSEVTRNDGTKLPAKWALGRKDAAGKLAKMNAQKEKKAREILKAALEQIGEL